MKNGILLFFIFLFCKTFTNFHIPIDSNSEKIKISKIENSTENLIYLIEDLNYWKTNSIFLITPKNIYFFSSGWSPKSAQRILWKSKTISTLPFGALLLISPSLEFSGGIVEFTEKEMIPAYIHKEGYLYLKDNWISWQKLMKKKFLSWEEILTVPEITGLIDNQFIIEENIFLFYPGIIREPGNLVAYFSKEQILYAGNLLFDPEEIQFYIENANIQNWLNLLEHLKKLNIKKIVTGKGKALHNKDLIPKMILYLSRKNI